MKTKKSEPKEVISKQLLSLKDKPSWSLEGKGREFFRVMGEEGPSHTTLLRYASGKVKRRNAVTERYVREAIHRVKAEFIQKELSESETQRKRVEKVLEQARYAVTSWLRTPGTSFTAIGLYPRKASNTSAR